MKKQKQNIFGWLSNMNLFERLRQVSSFSATGNSKATKKKLKKEISKRLKPLMDK